MRNLINLATFMTMGIALIACSSLPRGAAVQSEITRGADKPEADFAVYPVTRAFLPTLAYWPKTGERQLSWINTSRGSTTHIIRPGDKLDMKIWDSGENSLLTSSEQRVVDLSNVVVSSNGSVFVPYVGKIVVSGKTPDGAREAIQRDLEAIVPSAQVQLSFSAGRANSVDLVGGVAAPGSYPMPDQNYTILSLIAEGGGVAPSIENPQIRLIRGASIYGTSIDKLYETPSLDTRLRGNDQVIVEEDRRYFLSLGATGSEALHVFTKDEISAMDAVSITGGIKDGRGDLKGILIMREYPASAVRPGERGPREQRVVFALDLTNSDGLFSARKFQINSGDLVYASESKLTGAQTILGLVGSVFGIFNTVSTD
jgi:polysaccharide export outer membrane protein